MSNDYRKVRGIPDKTLDGALRDHKHRLDALIHWANIVDRQRRLFWWAYVANVALAALAFIAAVWR